MRQRPAEPINMAIMENEKNVSDWSLNTIAWELYWWVDFFNTAFFRDQPVSVPVISFEKGNINSLGHYVIGRNAFGVKENININHVHLSRPMWDVLATLLHEMVHSWEHTHLEQEQRTRNWHHKKGFQVKLLESGIVCNERGDHLGVGDPFVFMLRKHGVSFNLPCYEARDGFLRIPPKKKPKGTSKLKKWSCGCTNVRVATELEARCLKCSNRFELA